MLVRWVLSDKNGVQGKGGEWLFNHARLSPGCCRGLNWASSTNKQPLFHTPVATGDPALELSKETHSMQNSSNGLVAVTTSTRPSVEERTQEWLLMPYAKACHGCHSQPICSCQGRNSGAVEILGRLCQSPSHLIRWGKPPKKL